MDGKPQEDQQVIGLTGSVGSGCSYVATNILAKCGFETLSLSTPLRDQYAATVGSCDGIPRQDLQEFGDSLRKTKGPQFLAKCVIEIIDAEDAKQKFVIDSIRNPEEAHFLRARFPRFFLFGVYASKECRWKRKQESYNKDRRQFDEDDERDTGRRSESFGQRVEACFAEADVVISNDKDFKQIGNAEFEQFSGKVKGYVDLISHPPSARQPTQMETLMAAAYTLSQRSSCMQRKVGAVIIDDEGNIISSGFNEVPRQERPCRDEYKTCKRKWDWQKFTDLVQQQAGEAHKALLQQVREEFPMLDRCRALHAEENAIISLARNGRSVPLDTCTLYTTTYPCRLCASKIVNLGIKHVVYCEPYPDPEAKVILQGGDVKNYFFEGITFKAYPRIYGDKK